jgi:hypothetical protein
MLLLWFSSVVGVWVLLDFGRGFNESPDCLSTRWEVGLAAAPVVYYPQKLLRYPHLKQAILRVFRWAATGPFATSHFYHFYVDINPSTVLSNDAGRWQAANSPPALTQATEVSHGSG